MATSAVPGAMTALLAILRAAPALSGVQVIDGPPTTDMADPDIVAVGWAPDDGQSAQLVQAFNAAGARTRDEDFEITGYIDCWRGDHEFGTVRERAFALLAVIESAIRASGADPTAPTLNGAVMWAHLTAGVLRQSFTDQGTRAALTFTVTCHARI
jgi:hypothetical protein